MDRKQKLNANIWKYYLIRIMAKRIVWPILTFFLLRNELSPAQIGVIFATGSIVGLLLEVPSGALADKFGRRNALILANLGWALSMLIFAVGDSFTAYLIANAAYWAFGTLWSGTHEALIYETLHELGRKDDIKRITGRSLLVSQVGTGIIFVIVPIIAKFSLHLPFWINVFVFLIGALLASSLTEPARTVSIREKEIGKNASVIKTILTNRFLLVSGLFFAVASGIKSSVADFRQLYLDQALNLDVAYFGLIYLGLRVFIGLVGENIERLEKSIGGKLTFLMIPAAALVGYTALYFVHPPLAYIVIILDGIQEGLITPLEQEYINKSFAIANRATLLSVFKLIESFMHATAVFATGLVINITDVRFGFLFVAWVFALIAVPLSVWFLGEARKIKLFIRPPSKPEIREDVKTWTEL